MKDISVKLLSSIISIILLACPVYAAKWHENVTAFYQEGGGRILNLARQHGVRNILLLPEVNKSNYHIASPDNEGLAITISDLAHSMNYGEYNILFWKGDIAPFKGWVGRLLLSGKKALNTEGVVTPKGVWYQLDRVGDEEYRFSVVEAHPPDSYRVRLIIEDVELDKESKMVSGTFSIQEESGKVLFNSEYRGSTTQLRWFAIRKPWSSIFYLLSSLSLVFLLWFLWLLISVRAPLSSPETMVGTAIVLLGISLSIFLTYINPLHRERLRYYDQTSLIFIIDNNSEVFFPRAVGNPSEPLDLCYIVKRVYSEVRRRFVPDTEDLNYAPSNWWRWVRFRLSRLIFEKERYELNTEYGYLVHAVSGAGRSYTTHYALHRQVDYNMVVNGICQDRLIREPRLVIPKEELRWIKERYEIPEENSKYALFFTSASSPSGEDVESYASRTGQFNNLLLSVFSVFLPTIPRTGFNFNNHYNFEEGKLSLLRRVSDYTVSINDGTAQDVDLLISIFNYSDLGKKSWKQWDIPQDLEKKRIDYFVLPEERKGLVDRAAERIAEEFERFVKGVEPESSTRKRHPINVLATNDFPLSLSIIISIIGLLGTTLFSYVQYNNASLGLWLDNKRHKWLEYLCIGLSYPIFLIILFLVLYLGDDTQRAVYLGHPRLALLGVIGFWLCFLLGPFLIFRFHYVGKAGFWNPMADDSMSWGWAVFWALLPIILTILALFGIPNMIVNIGWRLVAMIGLPFLLFFVVFASDLSEILARVIPGQIRTIPARRNLARLRRPLWASSIKLLLGIFLTMLLYGALWANPTSSPWHLPMNISYQTLTLLVGCLWSLTGLGIILSEILKKQ